MPTGTQAEVKEPVMDRLNGLAGNFCEACATVGQMLELQW
jgi:hypothetical protein